jgi:hypothetical protein
VEILHRGYYARRPGHLKNLEERRANEEIARKIYELRTAAGLTQAQLANLIGHDGFGYLPLGTRGVRRALMGILRRIGAALNQRVEIRFVPIRRSA